jgi:hypothetical protein
MAVSGLGGLTGTGSSGIQDGGLGGGGIGLGDVSDAFNVEFKTITLTDVLNQFAIVTNIPASAVKTKVEVVEGQPADYGIDYIVDPVLKKIDWAGLGLDGILAAGDKLRITYFNI